MNATTKVKEEKEPKRRTVMFDESNAKGAKIKLTFMLGKL